MPKKQFLSQRVINQRQIRLRILEEQANSVNYASESDNEADNFDQNIESINLMKSNTAAMSDDNVNTYETYHDDEHDNTEAVNDFKDDVFDHSPPLFNGCRFSTIKAVKMLINFVSRINLDKLNTINLMKLIKTILPAKSLLPTSWKSIMKLVGKVNFSSTTFLCSKCLSECKRTRFNTRTCINDNCSLYERTLKTTDIVELVNLDIRTQIKSIVSRNINVLNAQNCIDLFPTSDVTAASFYKTTQSNTNCNTISIIIHTDGAPLIRSTKSSIWPCFASRGVQLTLMSAHMSVSGDRSWLAHMSVGGYRSHERERFDCSRSRS